MNILQSYYTSCRKGQLGGAGFQFYAYSDGLSPNELKELSIIGNYVPPLDLPTQPTPEEREKLFPISFCYFKLKSGRTGVCQSKYIGQDYSGRYGNFFAHCLILEKGSFPFHPVHLFGHSIFKDSLTADEEQVVSQPPPLPILDLNTLKLPEQQDFKSIGNFLTDNLEDVYLQMMNALFIYKEKNRRIVFADDPKKTVRWIEALTTPLPLQVAQDITFSTYSFDPANTNLAICYTPAIGTRFQYNNQVARDFQYYLFNLSSETYSTVDHASAFVQMLPVAFEFSTKKLVQFHEFLTFFNYQHLDKKIDDALGLFNLIQGGSSLERLSYDEIQRFFQFAVTYDRGEYLEQLVDFIMSQNNPYHLIEKLNSFEQSLFIIKILFAGAEKLANTNQKEFTCEFYADSVFEFIDHKGQGLPRNLAHDFVRFNMEVFQSAFAKDDFFVNYILAPDRITTLQQIMETNDSDEIKKNKDFSSALLYACIYFSYAEWKELCDAAKDFLLGKIKTLSTDHRNLTPILRIIAPTPTVLFNVLTDARQKLTNDSHRLEELYQSFITIYNEQDKTWTEELDQKLYQKNEVELILRLAAEEIETALDRVAAFDKYLEKHPKFFKEHADRFAGFLIKYARALNIERPGIELNKLLTYSEQIPHGEFQYELINILEEGINLTKPQKIRVDILSRIHVIRSKHVIKSNRNGLEYVYWGKFLEDEKLSLREFYGEIKEIGILSSKYEGEILEWLLEILCDEMDQKNKIIYLLAFLAVAVERETIGDAVDKIMRYGYHNDVELIIFFIAYLAEQELNVKEEKRSQFVEEQKLIKKRLPKVLVGYRSNLIEKVKKAYIEDSVSLKYWNGIWKKAKDLKDDAPDSKTGKFFKSIFKRK